MQRAIFINGKRSGYSPGQVHETMTVGALIEWLRQYDDRTPVFLRNDNGYTYGGVDGWAGDIYEGRYDERGHVVIEGDEEFDEEVERELDAMRFD